MRDPSTATARARPQKQHVKASARKRGRTRAVAHDGPRGAYEGIAQSFDDVLQVDGGGDDPTDETWRDLFPEDESDAFAG